MKGTVIIAGGGTGGHIFPAIAIAQSIQDRFPGLRAVMVGTRYGMEKDLVPKAGFPLYTVPMRGVLGKSRLQKLALLWRIPASLLVSLWLLLRFRPKAVIGVGGYASAPLLLTAGLVRLPVMIQEQNAFPGVANRFGARFAKLACVGFAEAAPRLRCPSRVTGNPVRAGFGKVEPWQPDRNLILVLGGSQGAKALNDTLPKLFASVIEQNSGLRVLHQCGARHLEAVRASYGSTPFPVEVTPFIENVAEVLSEARVVVCRAGASTIAELKLARVPALLVPFPGATHDHQTHNARGLADAGAAWHIPESELSKAGDPIKQWLTDRSRLAEMAAAYPSDVPDAAALCAEAVGDLIAKRPSGEILQEYAVHV